MELATIIGIVAAFAAIFGSTVLEGGNPMAMFLIPPMMLVFVGTLGAASAGNTMADVKASLTSLPKAFTGKVASPTATVETLVSLADRARREGLLALEDATKNVEDPFLQEGLQLAIDGTDPDDLADVLSAKIDAKRAADKHHAKYFADAGAYAPTIGIIGTVLGLVHVLENLAEPAELGHLIAAAFIATLWGVMTANVMWLPIANKLKRLSELECGQMELVVEGILAIQSGANPRMVARKLESLVPQHKPAKKAA